MQGHAGEPHAGIMVLQKHLDAYLGSAGRVGLPHFQALLADLYLLADDRQRALEALRVGQEHIETTGERYYEPELQWLMGRALIAKPARDPAGAAAAYERAAQAADRQDAKLLQLRALTALAKLQRRIGADCTALARVESLCRWFATDSEVPDVVAARALVSDAAMLG